MNHAMWLPMVEFLLSQIIASAGYWASTHPHCKISFSARQEFKQVCKTYWCKRWRVFKSVNHYMLWYKKVAITFYLQQGENETITKNTYCEKKILSKFGNYVFYNNFRNSRPLIGYFSLSVSKRTHEFTFYAMLTQRNEKLEIWKQSVTFQPIESIPFSINQ